jgi:hypothetical protein
MNGFSMSDRLRDDTLATAARKIFKGKVQQERTRDVDG